MGIIRLLKLALLICSCAALFAVEPSGTPELIPFSFIKKPLVDIIAELAQKKDLNLILPTDQTALDALKKQTITFQLQKKRGRRSTSISVDDAWNLLQTFIELSGFSLIHRRDNLYSVEKAAGPDGSTASRDILPLFVDTPISAVPRSDTRIRYLYFLRNLKVPSQQDKESSPIFKVIKELLSKDATVLFDAKSNGLLMIDRATRILSALNILKAMDHSGFKEGFKYVHLAHVPAADVVKVLDTLKKAAGEGENPFIRSDATTDNFSHFGADTKIFADERQNGIILIGRVNNIERIAEFIEESVDIAPERGQSILHSYDLQYLDAQTFAPQLQKIVTSYTSGEQATQQQPTQGTTRFFSGVQVVAEPIIEEKKEFTTEDVALEQKGELVPNKGVEGISTAGGNRLIIAANQDDWHFIKTLLEKLDIPQYQVVLEIFLVDFTYDHTTAIEGDIRSKTDSMLPRGVQFLASHITPVSNVLGNTPTQLAEDLLQVIGPQGVTPLLNPGSTLVSFNDPLTPGIFGLLLLLETVVRAKVTSNPYIFVTNHKKGSIESQDIRRTSGDLSTVSNGSFTIPIEDVPATLKVEAVPHILTDEKIRLDIALTVEQFVGNTFNRLTRSLSTTATLKNGQILAMGGLLQNAKIELETNTPFFARIPLIGWFFKGRSYEYAKTNITLFVSPTVISPKKRAVSTKKTADKICESQEVNRKEFFDMRDPVSRIFFKSHNHDLFNQYLRESTNLPDMKIQDCYTSLPIAQYY